MSKQINNYGNVCLPKSIDNTYRLALNGFRFQPDSQDNTGKLLYAEDINGEIKYTDFTQQEISIIPNTVIQVHPTYPDEGNKRSSVYNAIQYANSLTPSSSNIIQIVVQPATYLETNQLVLGDYVYLRGIKAESTNIILNTTLASPQPFVSLTSNFTSVFGVSLNAQTNADYTLQVNTPIVYTERTFIYGGNVANIHIPNQNGGFFLRCTFFRTTSNLYVVHADTGYCAVSQTFCQNLNTAQTGISYFFDNSIQGAGLFDNQIALSGVALYDTAVKMTNSFLSQSGGDMSFNNIGYDLDTSSTVIVTATNLNNLVNNVVTDATSSFFSTNLILDISNISIGNNDNLSLNYIETDQDNLLGIHSLGNLSVGDKTAPGISFFGQGSYNVAGVQYLKFNGSTFTDVSNDLKPSAGTTTTLFDDLTNSIFYVGDDEKFYSLEYDVNTILSGDLQFEYWDGSAWTVFNTQTTQADIPYGSYEDVAFSAIEEQDTRFNIELSGSTFNWTQTAVNGSTQYWIRSLPSAPPLTTSPVLNFLRILYNTTKIDKNGVSLRFGNSRAYKTIVFDLNTLRSPGSAATRPADQDLYFGEDSRLGREQNSLGVGDIVGFSFFAPNDLDSSSPIKVYLAYCSSSTAAVQSNYSLQVTIGNLHIGDLVYFTQAAANGNQIRDQFQTSVPLPVNQTNGRFAQIIEIPASVPFIRSRNTAGQLEELLHVDIERESDGNSNDLVLIQVTLSYLSFSDGITPV